MSTGNSPDDSSALHMARETIARQAAEIERLQRELNSERFAGLLRQALTLTATVSRIGSPVSHARLLEMIVEVAAQVISARAASLFLINRQTQELTFEVALGQKAEAVRKFTVPMGHGIAGLVAVSGQPLAVSDASKDPRQAADIARSVGYTPNSILCVPLYYNDAVIGVLELLDKEGAPSFSPSDMETLGLFANLAAVAIEQSRTHQNLSSLMRDVLVSRTPAGEADIAAMQEQADSFAGDTEDDVAYRRSLEMAQMVHEIALQGENETAACKAILQSFSTYLRARGDVSGEFGTMM